MNRVTSFLFGVIAGAAALYGSMHYYVIRSTDGFHTIAKITPRLTNPYVDVRNFTALDWQKNQDLALASLRANKGKALQEIDAIMPTDVNQPASRAPGKLTGSSDKLSW